MLNCCLCGYKINKDFLIPAAFFICDCCIQIEINRPYRFSFIDCSNKLYPEMFADLLAIEEGNAR